MNFDDQFLVGLGFILKGCRRSRLLSGATILLTDALRFCQGGADYFTWLLSVFGVIGLISVRQCMWILRGR